MSASTSAQSESARPAPTAASAQEKPAGRVTTTGPAASGSEALPSGSRIGIASALGARTSIVASATTMERVLGRMAMASLLRSGAAGCRPFPVKLAAGANAPLTTRSRAAEW